MAMQSFENPMSFPSHRTGLLSDIVNPQFRTQSNPRHGQQSTVQGGRENQPPPQNLSQPNGHGLGTSTTTPMNNKGNKSYGSSSSSKMNHHHRTLKKFHHKTLATKKVKETTQVQTISRRNPCLVKVGREERIPIDIEYEDLCFMVSNFWKNLPEPLPEWYIEIKRHYTL